MCRLRAPRPAFEDDYLAWARLYLSYKRINQTLPLDIDNCFQCAIWYQRSLAIAKVLSSVARV